MCSIGTDVRVCAGVRVCEVYGGKYFWVGGVHEEAGAGAGFCGVL